MANLEKDITLTTRGQVAIITLDLPHKLNALALPHYFRLATLMREVADRNDIFITVLVGKGRFFSAGADVTVGRDPPSDVPPRWTYLQAFVSNNLELTQAFYSHPKILVAALNGPAVGLSAALVSHADFIYAAPHTFLLTPFTSLGLVTEGNASLAFVRRLGIAKANEALIMSKRIDCEELVRCGFVNKVFDIHPGEDEKFLGMVLAEVDARLGDHLIGESLLKVKELIQRPDRQANDSQAMNEVLGGLDRFLTGIPQKEFQKLASGAKKHKL